MPKPPSNRCTPCDVDWPDTSQYDACPLCGAETWKAPMAPLYHSDASKLVKAHAERLQREEEFERFYAERALAELEAEIRAWGIAGNDLPDLPPPANVHLADQ